MPSFPLEVFERVCEHVTTHELTILAPCSSTLCKAARTILYRDISIQTTTLSFVFTLLANPQLAEHVIRFKIVVFGSANVPNNFDDILSSVLALMPKLERLSISLPTDDNHSSALSRLPATALSKLRAFYTSFALDLHVADFLQKAPELVSLELRGDLGVDDPHVNIPSGCLSHLEVFTGATSAAQVIVPGRPLRAVYLKSGELTAQLVPNLSSSSVTALEFSTNSPVVVLQALASAMPHLAYLRVRTQSEVLEGYYEKSLIDNIQAVLVTMKNLIAVSVWGLDWKWATKPRLLVRAPVYVPPPPSLDEFDSDAYNYFPY